MTKFVSLCLAAALAMGLGTPAQAQRIVAASADTGRAPQTVAALGESARIGTETSARNLLFMPAQPGLLVVADGAFDFYERGASPHGLAYDAQSARIGVVAGYGFAPGFEIGVAGSITNADVAFQDIAAGFDRDTANVGAFFAHDTGYVYLSAAVAVGFDDFGDIRRQTGVAGQPSRGATQGTSVSAAAQAMGNLPLSRAMTLHPVVRLGWSRSDVDGYAETGAADLSQIVFDQRSELLYGEAGLGLSGMIDGGGPIGGHFWTRGTWHFAIDEDPQHIRTARASLPDAPRTADILAPDGDYSRIEAGVSANPVGALHIGLIGHASFGGDDYQAIGGQVFVVIGL